MKRAPRQKTYLRNTFHGDLIGDNLRVRRGAWVVKTDRDGNVLSRTEDRQRMLVVNIGDRLVIYPRNLSCEDVACVEVIRVHQDNWNETLTVRVLSGEIGDGEAFVMRGGRGATGEHNPAQLSGSVGPDQPKRQ